MKSLLGSLRQQPLGLLALFLVLAGGGAYAASAAWTGDNIVDGSLTGADVANASLTGADIQDGSLSAADITGIGGAAPLLDWTAPGPLSFGLSPNQVPLASVDFSVNADGFYDLLGKASLDTVGTACFDFFFANAYWGVDETQGRPVAGIGAGTGETTAGLLVWLTAGTHAVKIKGQAFCEGVPGTGSFALSGLRVVVKPA